MSTLKNLLTPVLQLQMLQSALALRLVASLPGAWRIRVSARADWTSVHRLKLMCKSVPVSAY